MWEVHDSEISELRKAGVSSSYSIDDKVFILRGLGLTTAAMPVKNINMMQNVYHGVRCIAKIIEDPLSEFVPIGDHPHKFELSLTPEGLALYDSSNNVAYKLASPKQRK